MLSKWNRLVALYPVYVSGGNVVTVGQVHVLAGSRWLPPHVGGALNSNVGGILLKLELWGLSK